MKSQRRRNLESRAGALGFRIVQKWLAHGDAIRADRIGARLGRLAFRLAKRRRERAVSNLELAFPKWTSEKRLEVAKGVFEHFGRVMCDFVRTDRRTQEELDASMAVEGLENLEAAFAKGRGVIVVTGHFGNWERMAQWITSHGYKMSVIVRDANNQDLNDVVLRLRQAAGVGIISRGNAARAVLTRLRKNEVVGILPDQNTAEGFIPFFGKLCGTSLGPAVLAERAKASVVPIYCYRTGPDRYVYKTEPELSPMEGYEDPIEGMMASVNLSLENAIREHPDQYLWIHDRWKAARQRGLL